jgi:nicotinamide riboside transporter PnuC
MRRLAVDSYVVVLWALCGVALYAILRTDFPARRPFWDSWTSSILIGIAAAIIVEPAGRALGFRWGAPQSH